MICVPSTTQWAGCGFTEEEIAGLDPVLKTSSEALAWYALASMTAFRIGVCETTVRPCAAGCGSGGSYLAAPVLSAESSALPAMTIGGIFTPYVNGQGIWVNGCGCSNANDCSCGRLSEVILPGPVGEITQILIDGQSIAPSRYRVDNGNRLVSTDPTLTWPLCQDMSANVYKETWQELVYTLPGLFDAVITRDGTLTTVTLTTTGVGELPANQAYSWPVAGLAQSFSTEIFDLTLTNSPGIGFFSGEILVAGETTSFQYINDGSGNPTFVGAGFSVTYYRGAAPNEMTNRAAGVLATEFYKSCTGKKCRLPRNARTVSRNGVEIEIEADVYAAMKLIPEVAIVVGLYNPHALKTAPRVRTPDLRRARETTGLYG